MTATLPRRGLLGGLAASAGTLLAGCDRINRSPTVTRVLDLGEPLAYHAQRGLFDRHGLAPEYRPDQMSPVFRTNGNTMPSSAAYQALLANDFRDWRLEVGGLVRRPFALSLDQIRRVPARTQITRHDCVEGWSAIGQWTGVPLRLLIERAGPLPAARYVVFRCADDFGGTPYYESVDLIGAVQPQTILAWAMNGRPLSVGHGAPLRLRLERQLGYKQAKFVMAVELVASLAGIGAGGGGYWEDVAGYQWFAGI